MATEKSETDGIKDEWIVDSGATKHMTNNLYLLDNVRET